MSPCQVLSLCVIGDICHRSFIRLNFAGQFSIETQLSMTSHGENEAVNAAGFSLFSGHFVKFEWCFCSKTDHFTSNLGANMIKHVSEMELYIILSTLEKFEAGIRVLITKYYPKVHGHPQYLISVGFSTWNKYYFH